MVCRPVVATHTFAKVLSQWLPQASGTVLWKGRNDPNLVQLATAIAGIESGETTEDPFPVFSGEGEIHPAVFELARGLRVDFVFQFHGNSVATGYMEPQVLNLSVSNGRFVIDPLAAPFATDKEYGEDLNNSGNNSDRNQHSKQNGYDETMCGFEEDFWELSDIFASDVSGQLPGPAFP